MFGFWTGGQTKQEIWKCHLELITTKLYGIFKNIFWNFIVKKINQPIKIISVRLLKQQIYIKFMKVILKVFSVLERYWSKFMIILEAALCGAVEYYCVVLREFWKSYYLIICRSFDFLLNKVITWIKTSEQFRQHQIITDVWAETDPHTPIHIHTQPISYSDKA